MSLSKTTLDNLYIIKQQSVARIANSLGCSQSRVNYWLRKYKIQKRSISEATYTLRNPKGDPFTKVAIRTDKQNFLFGLGLGLYWGEGTKKNRNSVRLGNSDPDLIRVFIKFLESCYQIDRKRLRFGLQLFSDSDVKREEMFWRKSLKISGEQFYKTTVTVSGRVGTYKEKTKHGVLTVYFNNTKLRNLLVEEIENLRKLR